MAGTPVAAALMALSATFGKSHQLRLGIRRRTPEPKVEMLLVNDNDFGVDGVSTEFWRVTFEEDVI